MLPMKRAALAVFGVWEGPRCPQCGAPNFAFLPQAGTVGTPPSPAAPQTPQLEGCTLFGGGSGSWLGCPPQKPSGDGGVTPQAAGVPGWGGGGGMVCCRKCLLHVAPHRGAQPPRLRLCNPGGTAGQRLCLGGHCQLRAPSWMGAGGSHPHPIARSAAVTLGAMGTPGSAPCCVCNAAFPATLSRVYRRCLLLRGTLSCRSLPTRSS